MVRIALAATAVLAIPYLLPSVPSAALLYYSSNSLAHIPLIALTIAAMQYRLGSEPRASRRFWNLWSAGLGLWLVQVVLNWLTPEHARASVAQRAGKKAPAAAVRKLAVRDADFSSDRVVAFAESDDNRFRVPIHEAQGPEPRDARRRK